MHVPIDFASCEKYSYHLINLLQSTTLGLGQEEKHPEEGNDTRGEPDVAVSRTPVERVGVDEVGRGKGGQPG